MFFGNFRKTNHVPQKIKNRNVKFTINSEKAQPL